MRPRGTIKTLSDFEWRVIEGKIWTYIFDSSVKETTFVDMRTFDRILSMKKKKKKRRNKYFRIDCPSMYIIFEKEENEMIKFAMEYK